MTLALPSRARGRRSRPRPAERAVARPIPVEISILTETMTMVSLVCVWLVLQLLVLGGLSESREQSLLYDRFRTDLAAATVPVGGLIAPGTPVAEIKVPALGLDAVVVEGTSSTVTLAGPGHRRDTVLPGQPGTSVVHGRASTYGAPFAQVTTLRKGDRITTITGQGTSTYEVEGVRRAGDPTPQPLAGDDGRLVLVSAEGSGRLSALSPGQVVYVDAKRVSAGFEPGAARIPAVATSEQPMGRDTSVLPLLTLALAGCAVAVGASAFAVRALGRTRAWVLMAAPVVAIAWLTTDVAMGLLPNLM